MRNNRTCLLLLILLFINQAANASEHPDFDDLLARYRKAATQERPRIIEKFITGRQTRGGFPIIANDGTVFFFYHGNGSEKEVRVVGDFRTRSFYNVGWDEAGEAMVRAVNDSPLFYARLKFEKDARVDYKFAIDGNFITDPLNPRTIESGTAPAEPGKAVATASQLVMPDYKMPDSVTERSDVRKGKLIVVEEAWATPKISIYLPPDYNTSRKFPVMYTADGTAWIDFIRLPVILNNLIAEKRIEPVIAVMIDSMPDRRSWYYYNPQYLVYLEKVVHYVDSNYSTMPASRHRLHAGTSAGGAITLYTGFERPDLFLNVAMLSASLTGPPHYYEPYFSDAKRPDRRLKIWLSAGTYEPYIHQDAFTMQTYFKRVGISAKSFYTHEGHSFGTWRRSAQEMLQFFFGSDR